MEGGGGHREPEEASGVRDEHGRNLASGKETPALPGGEVRGKDLVGLAHWKQDRRNSKRRTCSPEGSARPSGQESPSIMGAHPL